MTQPRPTLRAIALACLLAGCAGPGHAPPPGPPAAPAATALLPTGQAITPLAAPGARFDPLTIATGDGGTRTLGQAAAVSASPDGATLAVLTSGYDLTFDGAGKPIPARSTEAVLLFDVTASAPKQIAAFPLANSYLGLAWSPDGATLYVSGGPDDAVYRFVRNAQGFAAQPPIALGHRGGAGPRTRPMTAGLAVSPDGDALLAANYQNDSVSLIDTAQAARVGEIDLRPGKLDAKAAGTPGGEFPVAVVWASPAKAYVAAQRDREIVVLARSRNQLAVTGRIAVRGTPTALAFDPARGRLYALSDAADTIATIDVASDRVMSETPTGVAGANPEPAAAGANPEPAAACANPGLSGFGANAAALSADGGRLYATLGGANAVAAFALDGPAPRPLGLIPTGWYPTGVALSAAGDRLFVVNLKSDPGPNPAACLQSLAPTGEAAPCRGANQFVWQLEQGGLLSLPVPPLDDLARLTRQVAANLAPTPARPDAARVMTALHRRIRHVVYIIKENRTYDQVLGDLEVGDGDRRLALLPEPLTPNHHALARSFVTFDRFFDPGEVSGSGWNWSVAARTLDVTERTVPVYYANRGFDYDYEGQNRNIAVGRGGLAERRAADPLVPSDPDLLPGPADIAAPDAAGGDPGAGYLWDDALDHGLTVRNYGMYGDIARYFKIGPGGVANPAYIPRLKDPAASNTPVFFADKAVLMSRTDPFYRGFDMGFADFWRAREWSREFARQVAADAVPNLTLIRLPHDHTGGFGDPDADGVNTVETQVADNDYALGRIVETIAASPVAGSTLIAVVEDDAQNGADHVNAHRSIAYLIGPYVRRHAVVSTRYTTLNLLRTIEAALDLPPIGANDAAAAPMSDAFDLDQPADWRYAARVPAVLRTTQLPLPPAAQSAALPGASCAVAPHDAAYWSARMAGQDFADADRLDAARYNAALWDGLSGACR